MRQTHRNCLLSRAVSPPPNSFACTRNRIACLRCPYTTDLETTLVCSNMIPVQTSTSLAPPLPYHLFICSIIVFPIVYTALPQ